ncbi:hypothetical protein ACFWWC_47080 [Streptomyces sp. NPDC058642]|uniref:hypothetical protein n=1 Tax=Streptomyces sp. NPDC058642 TaxID=3346572 RepID=UPI00366148B4
MPSLRERVAKGRAQAHAQLAAHALQWRSNLSDYAIRTAVQYAVEGDLADELHNILTDEQFRELRVARFGALALQDDLNRGLDYFSRVRPDQLRSIRLMFQPRSAERDDEYALLHRAHCQSFADFLQLDVPAAARQGIGLDRALRRLFPMRLAADDDAGPPVEVDLTGYQLGNWMCSCGARRGHSARYDFTCDCGAKTGNGRLSSRQRRCRQCGTPATYATCDRCSTRVTLSLWWKIRKGGVHPSVCQIPLILDLRFCRPGQPATSSRIELMQLPLMLGLTERDDELVFDLPDMLWVSDVRDRHGEQRPTGPLVSVADHPRYDRQTSVMRILECAFRRTLTDRGRPAGSALETVVAALAGIRRPGRYRRSTEWFSAQFARKVGYGLAAERHEDAGLSRGTDMSRPCVVAVSPDLRGDAALVSRALAESGSLSGSGLENVSVSLWITRLGLDELTAGPPEVPLERCQALASDGIVLPGETVEPGDLLVGISTAADLENPTPDERLLRAVFGERYLERQDASLCWDGRQSARVLGVHISVAPYEDIEIVEYPAREIGYEKLRPEERARISISLATTDPLETGDMLYGPDDSRAVVCGTHDGSADILVGPRHAWANAGPAGVADVQIRLRSDERSRSVIRARSTGAHSIATYPSMRSIEYDLGQLVRLAELVWLLRHDATRTAFEIYALRGGCIDWRNMFYELLVLGGTSLQEFPVSPFGDRTQLESAPPEAVRRWDRMLRSACVEAIRHGDELSFRALDDDGVLGASSGEVRRPDTVDLHTGLPVPGGLACQRIFGPVRDRRCGCGEYRSPRHDGEICERCGVEVTVNTVRRQRMGHIELAAPIVHPWYKDSLSRDLDLERETLADIIHGQRYIDPDSGLSQLILPPAAADLHLDVDRLCTGAEAVRFLLARREQSPARGALLRRLPVLPADLRPVIVRNGRRYGNSLNNRYVEIMQCNSRLRRLTDLEATPAVLHHARAELQRAVEALLDPRDGIASLADLATIVPGHGGGFRQRLVERPVDYSARATLVAESTGDMDRALLPDRLAWLLLEPVLLPRLVDAGDSKDIKSAKRAVQNRTSQAWAHLQAACQDTTVLVSVPNTRWPLLAVRIGLTADLSLKLDPALFDQLGWNQLGAPVRIFPLLTAEAAAETRAALLPSILLRGTGPSGPTELQESLLSLDQQYLLEEIVRMIGSGESAPLSALDRFLLFPE